ncbi:uncharacterized protein K489DRAFT_399582 [Dissoconium aciculare CBS 342.82]|uniref:PPP4R2-domain-containing protein n=1 Tax=Dissoconium aciculare CBS 342.82 TaxID=1314786 RepID=A0A6J3MBJ2_9PEZI|nr:uncharacterized protein K489DRAFT_399582 [Dissoconium aciculare CBS 342.82]KAF1825381.1 hypothetical protein K489DRAFT_399582 [Dissoconium aciculare CBS 342.82]
MEPSLLCANSPSTVNMPSSDQLLEGAAKDGSMDIAEWPRVLEDLLKRLHDIVHDEFPIPIMPAVPPLSTFLVPYVIASTPPRLPNAPSERDNAQPEQHDRLVSGIQEGNKETENEAPERAASESGPTMTPFGYELMLPSQQNTTPSTPTGNAQPGADTLPRPQMPEELQSLYRNCRRTLEDDFSRQPPYTVQRLAEMILRPHQYYRHLPAYLRALDRVVSVSSSSAEFPLPAHILPSSSGFLTNGEVPPIMNGTLAEREGLGSDESLGGALLTPIPWLQRHPSGDTLNPLWHGDADARESDETPNGADTTSSPDDQQFTPPSSPVSAQAAADHALREQGGVTQGELLRQEQQAGIVPIAQSQPLPLQQAVHRPLLSHATAVHASVESASATRTTTTGDLDEIPHARGPEIIGMEDTGPQRAPSSSAPGDGVGLDIDAAVGRARSRSPAAAPAPQPEKKKGEDGEEGKAPADPRPDEVMGEGAADGATGSAEEDGGGGGGGQAAAAAEVKKDADGDTPIADADDGGGGEEKGEGKEATAAAAAAAATAASAETATE